MRSFLPILLSLAAATPAAAQSWTPAWTASMWQAERPEQQVAVENATTRSAVQVAAAGSKVRLRLDNDYGPELEIGAASVRIAGGRAVPVTFGGRNSVRVPAGAPLFSDPVALPVKAFDTVEVSLFMPGRAAIATIHQSSGAPTFISPGGDFTSRGFEPAAKSNLRPLLASVEVLTARKRPVVVAYGDSITDNTGCTIDAVPMCRWSDVLARRLTSAGKPHVVVTQAISGNRILNAGTGPSALARFDRDVLALPGVTHLVILEGINDIGGSGRVRDSVAAPRITADQLIEGYRQLVARAHAHGIKVYAMTILPYEGAGYYTPEGEAMRTRINEWMRTSRTFDAVIDMEKVVADPANPKRLDPKLQRGDNLHPEAHGETKMGEAIPLGLFK